MIFTPQRVKSLHSIVGVNYSLDFLESSLSIESQKGVISTTMFC